MLMLRRLAKFEAAWPKLLLHRSVFLVHHKGQFAPKQHRFQWTDEEKEILYNEKTRIIPQIDIDYYDPINLPGYDQNNIVQLLTEFSQRKLPLAPTTLCMLIHMFTKHDVMTHHAFDQLEKQARRFKGEFGIRSIFGALRGCIIYNRTNLAAFFLEQYRGANEKFTVIEILQIMQAVCNNNLISQEHKSQIWKENFRADFLDAFQNLKIRHTQVLVKIFDLLTQLEETDKRTWNKMIQIMRGKKGWARVPVIERLYSKSGEIPAAKALFDEYFNSMAQDQQILQRYNLTQLRYHTPLELIKHAQENPSDYHPKIRTLIPEQYNADQWNEKYEQYLKVGAVKQEQQIIKDKSKSLGFAIRERYDALEEDNADFSKMSKEEFEEMFGDFDQTMDTIKKEDIKIAERQKIQAQKAEKQPEPEPESGKGKKGKGKQKGGDTKGEKAGKEKKQKTKKQQ